MIMLPLGGGRPSLQLASLLHRDEVTGGGEEVGLGKMREEEAVISAFLVENGKHICHMLTLFINFFKEREWRKADCKLLQDDDSLVSPAPPAAQLSVFTGPGQ